MSVDHTRYVFDRLLIDALRAEDVKALNIVTRAAGIMGKSLAERGEQPSVLTTGEPVDGFVAPKKYVEPGPCPQAFVAAMRGDICWADAKVLDGTRHQWQAHPRSTTAQQERGWHRYVCAVCEAEMEVDSSG